MVQNMQIGIKMKKLITYLHEVKKECVLAPLFKLFEALLELFVPLVMAAIIDKGIAGNDTQYIIKNGILLVSLGIVGLAFSIVAQFFAAKAATIFSMNLRSTLFERIQKISFTEMDKIGAGTLINRMTSDINQVQNGVNMTLRLFLRSPFIVFGAAIMAFTLDFKAAMIFTITIPILSLVVYGIMYLSIPLYGKVQAGLDKVLQVTKENLSGVRVIRAFGREEEEAESFRIQNSSLAEMQKKVGKISGLTNPLTYVVINLAIVALIWLGAIQVDHGVLSQGKVIALINYMSQILVELIKLANLLVIITKAVASANRIQGVMDIPIDPEQEQPIQQPFPSRNKEGVDRLAFEEVCFSYAGSEEEVLSSISFRGAKGGMIGVIGGTGAGKTSLVQLIPRFYECNKGRILLDGVDIREYPIADLRKRIGIVMQKALLFQGSIRDNLCWGKQDATDSELWEALEIAQAKEFVEQKEGGLSYWIEQGGKNLSGGQKQRLTIARALVRNPDILILDDSASALDFLTDAALRKAIRNWKKEMLVIVVSQRTSSVLSADHILVLDDGILAGQGTHNELLQSCTVYQEIYYSQFEKEA